jgi:hypothetical protein
LDIKSSNTYELNLDAFYSSSTNSNLGIYLASGSFSSSIGTLYGISPTKNLLDTTIPFKIDTDYPSASLYFSQSNGEWHVGNISLRLSQDTAFSPDEVSFITTMPTVIGNETFNFKFEFYDVNNNYVPVAVTQSATFTGGVNINNTLLLVSASTSQSLAELNKVSSSISGTMTVYSSSASSSVNILSGSVSGTIGSVSSSISGSIYSLSGSVSSSLTLTSGSITLVSSSLLFTSQSLSSSLTTLSASLSSSFSNAASQSAYQVYSASQYLDKFIFTDENGKLNQPPTASDPGLYLGSEYLGYYNGTGTSGWKTYMDNQGDFYLTSSVVGGGFLAWDSSTATLQIQGAINIQGGNAATTTALSSSLNAVSGAINSATASLSTSVATTTFTTATGLIAKPPSVLVGSSSGLYLGSTYLGYYNGTDWKTYMANNGNFYLSGAGSDSLTWAGGVLTINGAINITGGNVQSSLSNLNSTTSSLNSSVSNINSSITNINSATSSLDSRIFTTATGKINKTPTQGSTSGLYLGSTFLGYYNGSAWKTYMDDSGKFYLSGTGTNGLSWDGTTLSITGNLAVGSSVPNSVVSGLGSLALKSSVSATTDVTGLGGLATKSSVGASEIDAGAVTEVKLGSGAVTEGKIGAGAVSNAKIAADAVTEGKIAANAITEGKISANAVVAGKIAADAVTADKIAAGSITAGKISAGAVEADKIAANAITAGKISAGAIEADKIAANAITAGKISAGAIEADKIAAGAITAGKISTGAITADKIGANEINASKISSLSFYGKTARFDTGDIGGWSITDVYLGKDVGVGSGFGFKIDSTNKKISITDNATGIERVRIDPSTSIPALTVSDTASIDYYHSSQNFLGQANTAGGTVNSEITELGTGGSNQYGTGYFGIIGLIYGNEEIWVDTSDIPDISSTVQGEFFPNSGEEIFASVGIWLKVRQYASDTDAINQSNQTNSWEILIAERTFYGYLGYDYAVSYTNKYGGTIAARGGGSGNTPGTALWYRVEVVQRSIGNGYAQGGGDEGGNQGLEGSYANIYQYLGLIKVRYGRVGNGYSIFSPGGLQVYQGVRQYLNASPPDGSSSNFFEVKGKAQFLSALAVSGDFSVAGNVDANVKQFKITHPLDEKQNLYHTSTEAPRADLIYRGKIQLENGIGTASIDIQSNMSVGTFNAFTRDRQLYLQNNNSFDKVIGRIESGSIYVESENVNSNTEVDWLVVAERCDSELLNSKLYDRATGKYKTQNYKNSIIEEDVSKLKEMFNSGSI